MKIKDTVINSLENSKNTIKEELSSLLTKMNSCLNQIQSIENKYNDIRDLLLKIDGNAEKFLTCSVKNTNQLLTYLDSRILELKIDKKDYLELLKLSDPKSYGVIESSSNFWFYLGLVLIIGVACFMFLPHI